MAALKKEAMRRNLKSIFNLVQKHIAHSASTATILYNDRSTAFFAAFPPSWNVSHSNPIWQVSLSEINFKTIHLYQRFDFTLPTYICLHHKYPIKDWKNFEVNWNTDFVPTLIILCWNFALEIQLCLRRKEKITIY